MSKTSTFKQVKKNNHDFSYLHIFEFTYFIYSFMNVKGWKGSREREKDSSSYTCRTSAAQLLHAQKKLA